VSLDQAQSSVISRQARHDEAGNRLRPCLQPIAHEKFLDIAQRRLYSPAN